MDIKEFKNKYEVKPVIENKNLAPKNPLVSVCVQTYQHVNYIKECLEGILMQETDFPFEILLGEDMSSDGTREICQEYADKYPEKIRLFLHNRENNIKIDGRPTGRFNFLNNLYSAKGKHIALCEGDDYWTDPLKLQKQVDFLEANQDYSLVCGGYKSLNTETGKEELLIKDVDQTPDNTAKGFDVTIERFLKQWLTKTMTLTFRKEFLDFSQSNNYRYFRDVHLIYHLLKVGRGYYMKEVFGVYRIHEGGVFSFLDDKHKLKTHYFVYGGLFKKNKNDIYLKHKFNSYLKQNIVNKNYKNFSDLNKIKLIFELLIYSENFKKLKSNSKLTIKLIMNK